MHSALNRVQHDGVMPQFVQKIGLFLASSDKIVLIGSEDHETGNSALRRPAVRLAGLRLCARSVVNEANAVRQTYGSISARLTARLASLPIM